MVEVEKIRLLFKHGDQDMTKSDLQGSGCNVLLRKKCAVHQLLKHIQSNRALFTVILQLLKGRLIFK